MYIRAFCDVRFILSGLNATAIQKIVSDSINDLQSALKCAMTQLSEGNLTSYIYFYH